jgi:hypothetical protein
MFDIDRALVRDPEHGADDEIRVSAQKPVIPAVGLLVELYLRFLCISHHQQPPSTVCLDGSLC